MVADDPWERLRQIIHELRSVLVRTTGEILTVELLESRLCPRRVLTTLRREWIPAQRLKNEGLLLKLCEFENVAIFLARLRRSRLLSHDTPYNVLGNVIMLTLRRTPPPHLVIGRGRR